MSVKTGQLIKEMNLDGRIGYLLGRIEAIEHDLLLMKHRIKNLESMMDGHARWIKKDGKWIHQKFNTLPDIKMSEIKEECP